MFSPALVWPPQVKEEEGWRQVAPERLRGGSSLGKQWLQSSGELSAPKGGGILSGEVVSAGQRGTGGRRALLLWFQTKAVGSEGWSRRYNLRPHREETKLTREE